MNIETSSYYQPSASAEQSANNVVVVVDNIDPDNLACAYAATGTALGLNTKAVIVTGRFAHSDPTAPVTQYDPEFSTRERLSATRRMAGFLARADRDVPVFEGSIAPATVVPHDVHIPDSLLDI